MARDSAVRLGSTTARLAMIRRVFTKTNKQPTALMFRPWSV
jgi:hypothetical protein